MPEVLEVKNELSQTIDYGFVVDDLKTKVAADLAITINGVEDKAGYKLADTRRKEWVKVRTSIDKRRKEMNQLARDHIKRVDGVAAELTEIAAQAEDHVTKLVDEVDAAIEKAEKEKIDAIFNVKNDRLVAAGLNLPRILVDSMSDIDIDDKISEAVELARFRKEQAEKEANAKAEADRIAAEQAEANRIEAEKLAADRAAFAQQQADHKAEMERLRKLDEDSIAAERAELETQKAAQLEAQQNIEREQKRLADIERDRIDAEQQRERDKIEAERVKSLAEQAAEDAADKLAREQADAKATAERAERLKPDVDRLNDFANKVERFFDTIPTTNHDQVTQLIKEKLRECADSIRRIVAERVK